MVALPRSLINSTSSSGIAYLDAALPSYVRSSSRYVLHSTSSAASSACTVKSVPPDPSGSWANDTTELWQTMAAARRNANNFFFFISHFPFFLPSRTNQHFSQNLLPKSLEYRSFYAGTVHYYDNYLKLLYILQAYSCLIFYIFLSYFTISFYSDIESYIKIPGKNRAPEIFSINRRIPSPAQPDGCAG